MRRCTHRPTARWSGTLLLAASVVPAAVQAQTTTEVRDELLRQFSASMRKAVALAEVMPADRYTWSPGEGVMEVGHVYMHIARYNYLYPTQSLGMSSPEGVEMDQMESVRDKERVLAALERSRDWLLESMKTLTAEDLARRTELYGREVAGWVVLVQLVAHMNEHVGQSIAYARMNGVVPPWSR